jgi:ribosome-associated protein
LIDKTAAEKMKWAAHLAAEKKGQDIIVLEIGKVSVIADYFLIMSGSNQRHVQSLADIILEEFKKEGIFPMNQAGYREGRWILLDYSDVVVHIFQDGERKFYNLERLWGHAPKVDNLA